MDQFRQVRSGETIPGLPRQPWNQFLDVIKPNARGAPLGSNVGGPIEVLVVNGTDDPTQRFAVLGIDSPFTTFAQNPSLFFESDTYNGSLPADGEPFVITQTPLSSGGVGIARIQGQTRVQVNLTDTSHRYAGPTADPTQLTSSIRGPARILWCESDFDATGTQWAVVLLGDAQPDETAFVTVTSSTVIAGAVRGYRRINDGLVADWGYAALVWIQSVRGNVLPVGGPPLLAKRNLSTIAGEELWDVENCCTADEGGCDDTDFPDVFCVTLIGVNGTCYIPIYRSGTDQVWTGVVGNVLIPGDPIEVQFACTKLTEDNQWVLTLTGSPTFSGLSIVSALVFAAGATPIFPATATFDAGVNTTRCAGDHGGVTATIDTDMTLCDGSGSGGGTPCPAGQICNDCATADDGGVWQFGTADWVVTSGSCSLLSGWDVIYDSASGSWIGSIAGTSTTVRISCVEGLWQFNFSGHSSEFMGGTLSYDPVTQTFTIDGVTYFGCPATILQLIITATP